MAHQPWHKEYPGLLNLGFGRGQGSNPNYRGVREPDYFDPEMIRREAPMSAPAGYVPMDERVGPQLAPMESGVSPRQSGFTGSVEWDVMDGNIYDPLGASVTETEEERRLRELREKQERGRRNALASGFGEASAALLAPREWQPMANLGLSPGYAGRSRRFA